MIEGVRSPIAFDHLDAMARLGHTVDRRGQPYLLRRDMFNNLVDVASSTRGQLNSPILILKPTHEPPAMVYQVNRDHNCSRP